MVGYQQIWSYLYKAVLQKTQPILRRQMLQVSLKTVSN